MALHFSSIEFHLDLHLLSLKKAPHQLLNGNYMMTKITHFPKRRKKRIFQSSWEWDSSESAVLSKKINIFKSKYLVAFINAKVASRLSYKLMCKPPYTITHHSLLPGVTHVAWETEWLDNERRLQILLSCRFLPANSHNWVSYTAYIQPPM